LPFIYIKPTDRSENDKMARMLFLPVLLIILALAALLVMRVKSMFSLSRSKDITLSMPSPFGGSVQELVVSVLQSLKSLPSIQYQSEIIVNFQKIFTYSRTGPAEAYCKATGKHGIIELSRKDDGILVKTVKSGEKTIPGESPWTDFWCGISPLEESLGLFKESGMKIMAGNVGTFMERKYTEILVISHAMPHQSNTAFDQCFSTMDRVFGKNLSGPDITIRNFMVRILVNNLTFMPDHIETKFNIFRGEDFICDYLQNSRLQY